MAQQEVDKHWTMYEDLETEIKVLHDTIMKAFEEKRAPDVINNLTQEKERLIVRQKEVMDQMAILYSCHADLVALNQGEIPAANQQQSQRIAVELTIMRCQRVSVAVF